MLVRKHGRVLLIASFVVGLVAAGNLLQEADHLTGFSAVFMRMIIIVIALTAPLFGEIDDEIARILRTLPLSSRHVATARSLSMCVLYPFVLGGVAIGAAMALWRDSSGCVIAGLVWTFTAAVMATRTGLISGKGCLIPVAAVIALLFDIPARVEEVNAVHLAAFAAAMFSLPLSYQRRDRLINYFMEGDEPLDDDPSDTEDQLPPKHPPATALSLPETIFLLGQKWVCGHPVRGRLASRVPI